MKRRHFIIYSLIAAFLWVLTSCEKENKTYPQITILTPAMGSSYGYGDTALVKVEVTDSDGSLFLNLLNQNQLVSLAKHLVYQEGDRYEYELYFTDKNLQSGNYDLKVSASNGENSKSEFVEIYYSALPKEMIGLAALSRTGGSTAVLDFWDTDNMQTNQTVAGDQSFLALNSSQARITVAPESDGVLEGFEIASLTKVFEKPNPQSPGLPQYEFLLSFDDLIYSFAHTGLINGIGESGNIARSYNLPAGYIPVAASAGEPGLLVGALEDGKSLYHLFLLNPANGAVLKRIALTGELQQVEYVGEDLFVLTLIKNGGTEIVIYRQENNEVTSYAQISGEFPTAIETIGTQQVLVATTKKVLRLDPFLTQVPQVLYTFVTTDLEYDALNKDLYLASGNSVLKSKISGQPSVYVTTNDPILQIEIAYNK